MKELTYLKPQEAVILKKASGDWNEVGQKIVDREKKYKIALIAVGSVAGVMVLAIGSAVIRELIKRGRARR